MEKEMEINGVKYVPKDSVKSVSPMTADIAVGIYIGFFMGILFAIKVLK